MKSNQNKELRCIQEQIQKYDRYKLTVNLVAALHWLSTEKKKFKIIGLETKFRLLSEKNKMITPDIVLRDINDEYYFGEIKTSLPQNPTELAKKLRQIENYTKEVILAKDSKIKIRPTAILFVELEDKQRLLQIMSESEYEYLKEKLTLIEWTQKTSIRFSADVIFLQKIRGQNIVAEFFEQQQIVPVDVLETRFLEKGWLLPIEPPVIYITEFLLTRIIPVCEEVEIEGKTYYRTTIDELRNLIIDHYGFFFDLGEWTDRTIKTSILKEALIALVEIGIAKPKRETISLVYENEFYVSDIGRVRGGKDLKLLLARRLCKKEVEKAIRLKRPLLERQEKQKTLDSFL